MKDKKKWNKIQKKLKKNVLKILTKEKKYSKTLHLRYCKKFINVFTISKNIHDFVT